MNDHPEAPSAPPLKGRHQRPGRAGSAVALDPAMERRVPGVHSLVEQAT